MTTTIDTTMIRLAKANIGERVVIHPRSTGAVNACTFGTLLTVDDDGITVRADGRLPEDPARFSWAGIFEIEPEESDDSDGYDDTREADAWDRKNDR